MAYETGGAANRDALLQAIAVFAAAQGWTVNYNGNRTGTGAGLGTAIIISKAGQCHTTFRTHNTSRWIDIVGHDAYNAGLTTETQANSSSISRSNEINGPFQAYHLFAGNTYLYCVVETTAGVFKHFGCGILQTFGALTPAHFVYGSNWNMAFGSTPYAQDPNSNQHAVPQDSFTNSASTQLRADYDGVSNRWNTTENSLSFYPNARNYPRDQRLTKTSAYTQRAVLAAPVWTVTRPNSLRSFVGMTPDWRIITLDWIAPGDNLTLGSDVWKVFPVIRRNGGAGEVNSGVYGYAYKT